MRLLVLGWDLRPCFARGVGTCSEVFNADPGHAPRGAIAQAWSVAEILRAWILCAAEPPDTVAE